MQVYEIFFAELGTYAKIKVMDPEIIKSLVDDYGQMEREDYIRKVLEKLVRNMRPDILGSLKMMSRAGAKRNIEALFNACVMLNPGLDMDLWHSLAYSIFEDEGSAALEPLQNILFPPDGVAPEEYHPQTVSSKKSKPKKLTKAKFLNLERYLKEKVVGQDEAIDALVNTLKRSQVGLNDEGRPLGVFLFSGSSGVGKTHLARELHKYLYSDATDPVRIDCGEYQHKHDNQKLTGAPPGYVGHEDGGALANAVRANPDTVVLLDEVEKAHADIWNTFLRVFDEGILTDNKGRTVDFRNTVIIMTTNIGNDKVVEQLVAGGTGFNSRVTTLTSTKAIPPRSQVENLVNAGVRKMFKPEFLNRIDRTVVFNYLLPEDYVNIADLEIQKIDEKLSKKGIVFKWDERVLDLLIDLGVDSVRGARGMANVRRDRIETMLADKMIETKIIRGTIIELSVSDDDFAISIITPKKKTEEANAV